MQIVILMSILVLFLCLLAGMWRIHRGPLAIDRMLVAQLLGTTGVAVLLLITIIEPSTRAIDAALVFALLSAIAAIAFIQKTDTHKDSHHGSD